MRKLNLGCGPVYLPKEEGWLNTDVRQDTFWKIDEFWDFTYKLPVGDNSVDFILAWHIFEHIRLDERGGVMRDWFRVLKDGGKLAIAVPNIPYIFEAYQQKRPGYDTWFNVMVNVYGPYNGFVGDFHRWGYCKEELENLLKDTGFKAVQPLWESNCPEEIYKFTKGEGAERKVVFAEWALQYLCVK